MKTEKIKTVVPNTNKNLCVFQPSKIEGGWSKDEVMSFSSPIIAFLIDAWTWHPLDKDAGTHECASVTPITVSGLASEKHDLFIIDIDTFKWEWVECEAGNDFESLFDVLQFNFREKGE